jgi:hypothetical protein
MAAGNGPRCRGYRRPERRHHARRRLVLLGSAVAAARTSWTQVPSPNKPGSNELLGASAADASHVWAVGRVVSDTSPSSWRSLTTTHR